MNPDLARLQPYPFEKINALKQGVTPPADKNHIALSIGEPKHTPPTFALDEIAKQLQGIGSYPVTKGLPALRQAIVEWNTKRYGLPANSLDAEKNVLPVSGTREALFAFAQAVVDRTCSPLVMMPNPFYQIYEGAALLAGAEPYFMNTIQETGFIPDFDAVPENIWQRCQLLYICSPGNPTGAVMSIETLQKIIQLADKHDFVIASDECYSEIYFDENQPPPGILEAAHKMGRDDFKRCIAFNSLSKRSNLPGLRSGFVAGDADLIAGFLKYRTYHGCALPPPTQMASIKAWGDEIHVKENRALYTKKIDDVYVALSKVMTIPKPEASFYLWPETPIDDTEFARGLFEQQNITVVPGQYLSRMAEGSNPGQNRIRIAMVAPYEECMDAANRMIEYVNSL
ncbi:MAG: succinyldiaminopimelate transaminase [Gammaproteobacteria bacterium]|nr:succinyldiaminopimelate transaminase [Gammaproteobacteria bacterium]MDH5594108.1 succinyldiaminopimelate transaminase [Gammaproteobacteria bacterium]MDH5614420.1 succinyldiaminopimelate transaminase [Gammaproteobacteria bacterium]